MKRDEILRVLSAQRQKLHDEFLVKSLALFGSSARDEATTQSDVDLLVEFDRPIGLFHLAKTQLYLQQALGVEKVDLVLRRAIHPALRDRISREAILVGPLRKILDERA